MRARLHVYCIVRITLDDPLWNCKKDFRVGIRIVEDLWLGGVENAGIFGHHSVQGSNSTRCI